MYHKKSYKILAEIILIKVSSNQIKTAGFGYKCCLLNF